MAGFVRRFGYFPPKEVLTQIEGAVAIDLPPTASIQGVGTGCVALVGECTDAGYAVSVATNGDLSTRVTPTEVFGAQDLLNKFGGFDETIGKFGADLGNAFAALRNKRFPRLIVAPVDNVTPSSGTNKGIRVFRDLPTNKSASDPSPIVPVTGATVAAGREFLSAANRIRTAKAVTFGSDAAYKTGTDGSVTTAGAAATQTFTSAAGDFVNKGVKKGDILVVGVIGTNNAANTLTLRVNTRTSATALEVERLDGANFAFVTESSLAYRLHVGRTADSSAVSGRDQSATETGGYTVPARPLDVTVSAGTVCAPTVVPDAATASSWDVLSGLGARVSPGTALTYDANVHAPNAATNATIRTRYERAIDALLSDAEPVRDVNIVVSARKDNTIAAKLRAHVLTASERGLTRRAITSPAINQLTLNNVLASSAPGVGGFRTDRVDYAWPGYRHSVPEAVGFSLATSDGSTTSDGILDETNDVLLASVEANLAPERNPGQASEPVPTLMSSVLAFARGTPDMSIAEYIALRAAGIVAMRFDRIAGPIYQSGVTTSLTSGQKNISRRRMADFIQDSVTNRLNQLAKQPMTDAWKGAALAEVISFLDGLLSENNPAAQRISGYSVDDKSGNTDDLEAAGVHVIIGDVRLLATGDVLVFQTNIGEGVVITRTLT